MHSFQTDVAVTLAEVLVLYCQYCQYCQQTNKHIFNDDRNNHILLRENEAYFRMIAIANFKPPTPILIILMQKHHILIILKSI